MTDRLIEVNVHGVVVDAISNSTILLLTDFNKEKMLPIWIGTFEAIAISQALENHEVERPLTHDLIVNILNDTKVKLEKVVIYTIKGNTYHSYLSIINADGRFIRIDSRPSDAVAVALRCSSQIYVSEEVYKVATPFDLKSNIGKKKGKSDEGLNTEQVKDWLNKIKPSDF